MWKAAERQKGAISRAQLRESGLTDDAIDGRIARGALVKLHAGVFAIAGSPDLFERRVIAALLAAPEAVASHGAASFLLGLGELDPRVEITVPNRRRPRLHGVEVHRVKSLPTHHTFRRGAIRVTSVARTICDLAAVLDARALEGVLDNALAGRRVERRQVIATLSEMPDNSRGAGTLKTLLEARPEGARAESALEQDLHAFLVRARIRGWTPQYAAAGCRIDVAFPRERLALEVDSYRHHSSRSDWARDHGRAAALVQAGWRVLPVTLEDLRGRDLAERIRAALEVALDAVPSPGR